MIPGPAHAAILVGEGTLPNGDVAGVRADLSWGQTDAVDARTTVIAGEIAAEVGPTGPYLDELDALVAAVGRELETPVVSGESDRTHEATKAVIDVEEYRD